MSPKSARMRAPFNVLDAARLSPHALERGWIPGIDRGWWPCEILHQDACGAKGNLAWILAAMLRPLRESTDVVGIDRLAIFETQHVLQHDFQTGRQAHEIAKPGCLGSRNRIVGDFCAPGL